MREIEDNHPSGPNWEDIRPSLDAAMHRLSQRDRDAILLRYFEALPFAEVAARINLTENSARMRVERALEKLRSQLEKRGIASTAAALSLMLGDNAVVAAPTGLAASATSASFAGVTASGSATTAALHLLYSMTKLKVVTGLAIIALCVVGTAVVTQQHYRTKLAQAIDTLTHGDQTHVIATLQAENDRLHSEVHRLTMANTSAVSASTAAIAGSRHSANNRLDQLRVLTDLQKRKIVNLSGTMPFITQKGALSSAFIELFALTPEEQSTLQKAVDSARQQMGELAIANSTVSRDNNGGVVIHVKPFAEGVSVDDHLMDAFTETLGPDRNPSFLALGADQVERSLDSFGAEERTIILTPNPSGEKAGYVVQDVVHTPSSTSTTTRDFANLDELRGRYGPILTLVPAGF